MRRWSGVVRWLAVVAWAGVIFAWSAQPGSNVPGRFSEIGHLGEYAILGVLLVLALGPRREPGPTIAVVVLIAALYAITDEVHQAFVPMRTPDVRDWGLDVLGALIGALTGVLLLRAIERRRRSGIDRQLGQ